MHLHSSGRVVKVMGRRANIEGPPFRFFTTRKWRAQVFAFWFGLLLLVLGLPLVQSLRDFRKGDAGYPLLELSSTVLALLAASIAVLIAWLKRRDKPMLVIDDYGWISNYYLMETKFEWSEIESISVFGGARGCQVGVVPRYPQSAILSLPGNRHAHARMLERTGIIGNIPAGALPVDVDEFMALVGPYAKQMIATNKPSLAEGEFAEYPRQTKPVLRKG